MPEPDSCVDPTTLGELIVWVESKLSELRPLADQPIGGSGKTYLPVADGSGTAKCISLHAPSPAYKCWSAVRDNVDRLCSVDLATEFSQTFTDVSVKYIRDLNRAMRWLRERLSNAGNNVTDTIPDRLDRDATRDSQANAIAAKEPGVAPKTFTGGTLLFFDDRVELCGVAICDGPRSQTRRRILELLARKRNDGGFVGHSLKQLTQLVNPNGGQGTVLSAIRDLRAEIMAGLRSGANLLCGTKDVILSGASGYHFADSLRECLKRP